jgi:hypothetical protein
MSNELDAVLNGETPSAPETASVAGRTRSAVASGGASVVIGVDESIEAIYRGFSMVAGKFGESKLHKFELIAPASLVVVSKDKDSGVKSEERKTLEPGVVVTSFLKGNGNYMLNSIVEGMDIELKRVEDGVLPAGHKFAGTAVQTFEVLA